MSFSARDPDLAGTMLIYSMGIRLDLVETRRFGSRVIYERYRRARHESD